MRITVGNLKGGPSKTTTSVGLASALGELGKVLLVDADEDQPSATTWSRLAGDEWPETVTVVSWHEASTERQLSGWDHVVIDTGPKRPHMLHSAIRLCDTVIIPVSQYPAELNELPKTAAVVHDVGRHHDLALGVLLAKARKGRKTLPAALAAIPAEPPEGFGLPLLDTIIYDREDTALLYGNAVTGADLDPYRDLLAELLES